MDIYWTTQTGDDLRIRDVGTPHPGLQGWDRVSGWRDIHPRDYPHALFGLSVLLLNLLDDHGMLDSQATADAGISLAEGEASKDAVRTALANPRTILEP